MHAYIHTARACKHVQHAYVVCMYAWTGKERERERARARERERDLLDAKMCVERGVPRSARQVLVRAVGNVLPDKKNPHQSAL
jgi:predicted Ser/Thr protein kinase